MGIAQGLQPGQQSWSRGGGCIRRPGCPVLGLGLLTLGPVPQASPQLCMAGCDPCRLCFPGCWFTEGGHDKGLECGGGWGGGRKHGISSSPSLSWMPSLAAAAFLSWPLLPHRGPVFFRWPCLGEPVSSLCPSSLRQGWPPAAADLSVASLTLVEFLTFPITCVIISLH